MDTRLEPRPDTLTLQAALAETRKAFLIAVGELRPRLHRFCARMCGSPLDGEDVVQETLALAFFNLASLKDSSRLEAWLFRIAHNQCISFLRRQKSQEMEPMPDNVSDATPDHAAAECEFADEPVDEALAALVSMLPPMERACVLLKDILDYRLGEIAEVVDSTVGGVKAALHRGREKLRGLQGAQPRARGFERLDANEQRAQWVLLEAYVDCFNRRDWDALRQLIQADVRVEVVDMTELRGAEAMSTYFGRYVALGWEWRLAVSTLGDVPVVVHLERSGPAWVPRAAMRLWWRDGRVTRVRDYVNIDYLLKDAP